MERPPNSLKPFANRLAQLAMQHNVAEAAGMLAISDLWNSVPDGPRRQSENIRARDATGANNSDRVGIWKRQEKNGKTYFVRSMDMLWEWHLWANIGTIEPKGIRPRIVLIGESVARGYLYDPQFTPATALKVILDSYLGQNSVEVLDLARTDLGFEVKELAVSVLLLQPDAVIIFGGNNWSDLPVDPRLKPYVEQMVREQGIGGLKRLSEGQMEEKTRQLVKDVSATYKTRGVPLIWIIPEFNLGDWKDPISNVPLLQKDANRQWMNHFDLAHEALRSGDLSAASEHAKQMVELDQGMNASGYYILAECSQKLGELDKAKCYLESARDAMVWCPSLNCSPRPHSLLQRVVRVEAENNKHAVVDTPKLFTEHLNGEIPDRRLFLDYCHLSAAGIQITMAAAASHVLRILEGLNISWSVLAKKCAAPTAEVLGEASFLAAIHNAHWWQSYDQVYFYCAQALEYAPHVAKLMLSFIDMQTRTAPMLMCTSAEHLHELGSPLIDRYLFHSNTQQLDRVLLGAMVDALRTVGIDFRESLDQLRQQEHSVTHRRTDLLKYVYCSSALTQDVMGVARQRLGQGRPRNDAQYYRAYWRESRFVFVGQKKCAVQLRLTCRLPKTSLSQGSIYIEVNGEGWGEMSITRQWSTWDILIPGNLIRDNLNDVAVRWPIPEAPEEQIFVPYNDLNHHDFMNWLCAFGEIHSFTASDARKLSQFGKQNDLTCDPGGNEPTSPSAKDLANHRQAPG